MSTVISMLQTYGEITKIGLAVVFAIVGILLLGKILKQIKRLNTSLKSITENMQAYFDVILTEEEPNGEQHVEKEEEIRAKIEALKKQEEDEQIFNAVLQEYFS